MLLISPATFSFDLVVIDLLREEQINEKAAASLLVISQAVPLDENVKEFHQKVLEFSMKPPFNFVAFAKLMKLSNTEFQVR